MRTFLENSRYKIWHLVYTRD